MATRKQKIVKMMLEHETSYLRKGYNYIVEKEDEKYYYINFCGKMVKYLKFYFMEVEL